MSTLPFCSKSVPKLTISQAQSPDVCILLCRHCMYRSRRRCGGLDRDGSPPGVAMDPMDPLHVRTPGSSVCPESSADSHLMPSSVTAVFAAALPLLMKETRSAVVLTRIAKRLRKKTGDHRYRARVEDERASLKTLIWISCTRPLCECQLRYHPFSVTHMSIPVDLLVTEPVVASFSLWVGFAWGILYVLIEYASSLLSLILC